MKYEEMSVEQLVKIIYVLLEQNQNLSARVLELERQLALRSDNSGKPPSSDGLRKTPSEKRTQSTRGAFGRKAGGQQGHTGKTLEAVEIPDAVEVHAVVKCSDCGADLCGEEAEGIMERQVFDLPPFKMQVTAHRAEVKPCKGCGKRNVGRFPEGVASGVQYGPQVSALASYMQQAHFMPYGRLSEFFEEVFGMGISEGTLVKMQEAGAEAIAPMMGELERFIKAEEVKHADETGCRVGGKTQWVHSLSSAQCTTYQISPRRGDVPKEGMAGVLVHDHFKAYGRIEGIAHAYCHAHHLRELKALMEIEKEAWSFSMDKLLREGHVWSMGEGRKIGFEKRQAWMGRFEERYDRIVEEGLRIHEGLEPLVAGGFDKKKRGRRKRRVGHNLLLRFFKGKEGMLRFLRDPRVPFTNNQAEQDIRMVKVRQKISGGFRTVYGAQVFLLWRGLISTLRKQGSPVLQTIRDIFRGSLPHVIPT